MDSQERGSEYRSEAGTGRSHGKSGTFDEAKAREGAKLLLEAVGRNPNDAEVYDTWRRRVPETLRTLTEGRRPEEKPVMRTFDARTDSLVVKTGIPVRSLCEHHMLPFSGEAHVAYRPADEMVGLSKLVRYVRWQARQLTTQESLTHDIASGLSEELDAECVLVDLTATHMCEAMRGVETATETTTRERVGSVTEVDSEQFRESIRQYGGTPDRGL